MLGNYYLILALLSCYARDSLWCLALWLEELVKSGISGTGHQAKGQRDASLEGETINNMQRFILKFGLVALVFIVGPAMTGFVVHALLKPSVSVIFGIEIVKTGLFYVAVVALSLIVYLFLVVCAMRTWETFNRYLRTRLPKAFKQ